MIPWASGWWGLGARERKFVNLIQNLYLQSWKCQNSHFRPGNSQIKTCLLPKVFSWKMRQYAIFVPINLSLHMSKQAPSLQMCIWGKTKNPKSAFGVFILKVLNWLQARELGFGNLFSTLPTLSLWSFYLHIALLYLTRFHSFQVWIHS